jgi:starch synthase (maltosyl-transferring)
MSSKPASHEGDRVLIERVTPQIDGGRHPVKRFVGDRVEVGADVVMDGHELIGARVRYCGPGFDRIREAPLVYRFEPDRFFGSFDVDEVGRWQFTVEAWPDHWGTWRADLRKRLDAGQDVLLEIREGASLLRRAAKARGSRELAVVADDLDDTGRRLEDRLSIAFNDEVRRLMAGPLDPQELTRQRRVLEIVVDRVRARFGAWYEIFPRSQGPQPGEHGTFATAEAQLPRVADLGFDVVYLPPIHPIGRTHRKGRDNTPTAGPEDVGSPWAIGSEHGGHTAVDPMLGTLEDFDRFVEAAHGLGLEIALDYALQCSPDHPWTREHPEWFRHRADGTIRYAENPPKKYEDIFPLDFWCEDREALWNACADVFRFWIDHGVKIFRVDNPHTKPLAFWEWVIAEIQREHPDVVFLAEAFTRPKRMKALAKLGFTQSYSYYTWKNRSWELQEFIEEFLLGEAREYLRPNLFANTPDILTDYLQEGGRSAFQVRLLLAATLAPTYGIYSGFEICENVPVRPGSEEYLGSEKYELRWRDWNATPNVNEDIRLVNSLRRQSPALQQLGNLQILPCSNEHIFCFRRYWGSEELVVVVNLDPHHPQEGVVDLPLGEMKGLHEGAAFDVEDLLSGERYGWTGSSNYVRLDPIERVGHLMRVVGSE